MIRNYKKKIILVIFHYFAVYRAFAKNNDKHRPTEVHRWRTQTLQDKTQIVYKNRLKFYTK